MADTRSVLYHAVGLVCGTALTFLWILVLFEAINEEHNAPFGEIKSTDPVLAGPYSGRNADRWTANELHLLNKHVEKLLTILEELKGRMGE